MAFEPKSPAEMRKLAEAAEKHWSRVDIMLGGNPIGTDEVSPFVAACSPSQILHDADLIDFLTKEVEGLRACLAGDREVRPMTEERLDRILDFVEFAKSVAGPNDTATLLWADQLALIDEAVIASRCRALSTSGRAE